MLIIIVLLFNKTRDDLFQHLILVMQFVVVGLLGRSIACFIIVNLHLKQVVVHFQVGHRLAKGLHQVCGNQVLDS